MPPDLAERRDELLRLVSGSGSAGLFFDIDGTLAPIVPDPNTAVVPVPVRTALDSLSRHVDIAVLTGRDVATARRMVGLDAITYAGNHGAEWWRDGVRSVLPEAEPFSPHVRAVALEASEALAGIPGIVIEDKGVSASIHYRATADPTSARAAIDALVAGSRHAGELEQREGKMVVELRPPVRIDKGTALTRVMTERGLTHAAMFGDDLTDADAFTALRALREAGKAEALSVVVLASGTPQSLIDLADASLPDTAAVGTTLAWLAEALG